MSSRETLAEMDAVIAESLDHVGLLDTAVIKGIEVRGYYREQQVQDGGGDDALVATLRTFDCQAADLPDRLQEGDTITVLGYGEFRYVQPADSSTGRVILQLGRLL